MTDFLHNLLELSLEAAPWLVLGFALGGLMKALIPTTFLQRHLSGNDIASISKAAVLGAPLPLCSCGVIPAAIGLREAGASKPATASFLVATPETGVDSISITYALIGPVMAVVRPIAALASALTAGIFVALLGEKETRRVTTSTPATPPEQPAANACCSTSTSVATQNSCCSSAKTIPKSAHGCCDNTETTPQPSSGCCDTRSTTTSTLPGQAWSGIRYAFTRLLDDIVFWLAIGIVFAALTRTFLPADFLQHWGQGVTAMLVMMLVGVPMYICATTSTPMAAGLMMAGMSPGVALVFLLTGPATNISTLGVIGRELGQRNMWLYLLAVGTTALISGLLLDTAVSYWQIDIVTQLQAGHNHFPLLINWASLLLLMGLALRKLPHKLRNRHHTHSGTQQV
ncbi:MAG: hypothetical protein CSA79_03700 [Thiothrix nivea]|nr:MAG: hypothetical protein CSA79_03700 [Thiothrix nivea]